MPMYTQAFARLLRSPEGGTPPLLLDVRDPVQFAICALPGAHNLPLPRLRRLLEGQRAQAQGAGRGEEGDELARLAPQGRPGAFFFGGVIWSQMMFGGVAPCLLASMWKTGSHNVSPKSLYPSSLCHVPARGPLDARHPPAAGPRLGAGLRCAGGADRVAPRRRSLLSAVLTGRTGEII